MGTSQHTEMLREFHSKHLFTHHLDPNISFYCFATNPLIHPMDH